MSLNFVIYDPKPSANKNVQVFDNTFVLNYPCDEECSDCSPYFVSLPPGSYLLEAWGAEGGYNGGKGGYSRGILRLQKRTDTYIYIGSKGCNLIHEYGVTGVAFNGGGAGSSAQGSAGLRSAGSGGGGTDIRINGNDLLNRIIVAGGGGGASSANENNDTRGPGGYGGGLEGQSQEITWENTVYRSKGGDQEGPLIQEENTKPGTFGLGGSMESVEISTVSGGGGGWFGGSTSYFGSLTGGGGGSGYVLHSSSFKPLNYQLNDSQYFLKYREMKSGNEQFKMCDGPYFPETNSETGHSGSGCARITVLTSLLCFFQTCNFKRPKITFHLTLVLLLCDNCLS